MSSSRLAQLRSLLEETPNDSFLLFAVAKEYEKLDDSTLALEHYLQLLQQDPAYVGTYYHLGKLYEQLEDFQEAFRTYTKGMELTKTVGDQHAFSELAGARLNLGDEEDFE